MAKSNDAMLDEAQRYWWLLLLQGIAVVLIGWWLLTQPIGTTMILVQVLGFYWLIVGILDIVRAIFEKGDHRVWQLFGGIIGMIAGLFVLNNPIFAGVMTPTIFLWMIAFAFIINGVIKIFLGNQESDTGKADRSWGSFFVGLFYSLFGLVLLAMPLAASLATMILTAGILGIVGGIGMVVFSFRLKSS